MNFFEMMACIALGIILNTPQIQNFLLERNSGQVATAISSMHTIATKVREFCDNHNGQCPPAGPITATTFVDATGTNAYMPNPPLSPVSHQAFNLVITANPDGSQAFEVDDPDVYDPEALLSVPNATGSYSNATATTLHYSEAAGGQYKS